MAPGVLIYLFWGGRGVPVKPSANFEATLYFVARPLEVWVVQSPDSRTDALNMRRLARSLDWDSELLTPRAQHSQFDLLRGFLIDIYIYICMYVFVYVCINMPFLKGKPPVWFRYVQTNVQGSTYPEM